MKKQVVVRTYPSWYTNPFEKLKEYLNQGYIVVMCNHFDCNKGKGNEYILEKDFEESEE